MQIKKKGDCMKVIGLDKIQKCDPKVVAAFNSIVEYLGEEVSQLTQVVITSGARDNFYTSDTNGGQYIASWHDEDHGHRAIDFTFPEINIFYLVTDLYQYICTSKKGITEFEVCRGKGKQHFHIACGNEVETQYFTGVYK